MKKVLEDVAVDHQGDVITVMMNAGQSMMLNYFGFTQEDLPILFYVAASELPNGVGGHGSYTAQEVRVLRGNGG